MYAVVDIETTGGSAVREKITEIALFITDGEKILREYTTLVNPEKNIPHRIIQLTGITNEMVADAPRFYEIAKEFIEITEGMTFVAHNAWFDYSFIREEYKQLGYTYKRDVLCTLQLSRKLIPDLRSYSLGNLCDALGIPIHNRHRAAGDALATVALFHHLCQRDRQEHHGPYLITKPALAKGHPDLNPETIRTLPEEPGVYYFYDDSQSIIYIGKSKNIHQRVRSHFHHNQEGKARRMQEQVADIGYERTGTELIALLLESAEIKKHMPLFNRAQRRNGQGYGIYQCYNEHGYLCFSLERNVKGEIPLLSFTSRESGRKKLDHLLDKYHLCQKLCGLYDSEGSCFQYQIGICSGACVGEEPAESYNRRAVKALHEFELDQENFFILDRGRSPGEISVVKVEHGHLVGFGYTGEEAPGFGMDILHECVHPLPYNREMRPILKRWLGKHKRAKIIVF